MVSRVCAALICTIIWLNKAQARIDTLFTQNKNERLVNLWIIEKNSLIFTDVKNSFPVLDSVSNTAQKLGDERMYWYAELFKVINTCKHQPPGDAAIEKYYAMIDWAKKCPVKVVEGAYYHETGYYFFNHKKPAEGLAFMLQARSIFDKVGYNNIPEAFHYLYELACVYYNLGDYRTCLNYVSLAEKYFPGSNDSILYGNLKRVISREFISNPNTGGMACLKLGLLKEARPYFLKCLDRSNAFADSAWIAIVSGNFGRLYRLEGNCEAALPYFLTYYKLTRPHNYDEPLYAALELSACYALTGNKALADYYLQDALTLKKIVTAVSLKDYYRAIYTCYKAHGNATLAFIYADSLTRAVDNSNAVNASSLLSSTQHQLDREASLTQLGLQQEAAKRHLQSGFIIACGILATLAILLPVAINRYRIVLKDKEIATKNEHISVLEKQAMQNRLQNAENQLKGYLKNLADKNELMESISAELANFTEKPLPVNEESDRQQFAELHKYTILTEEEWLRFKKIFEKVHPNFFVSIKEKFPAFTPGETRLLALLKLNISHREMSNMLGVSIDTIAKTKYRMRKKLADINIDKDLEQFAMDL